MSFSSSRGLAKRPQAVADEFWVSLDDPTELWVLDNDLGGSAAALFSIFQDTPTVRSAPGVWVSLESGAVIRIDGDSIVYETAGAFASLAQGQLGSDNFTYTIQLGNGTLSTTTVTVSVLGVNDAPVAADDTASAVEDGAIIAGNVGNNDADIDNGASRTFALAGEAPAGFSLNSDGSWTFDPSQPQYQSLAVGEALILSISYLVMDEYGLSDEATLTVTVDGAYDAFRTITVTYATSWIVSGPISFGLTALPSTVVVTFNVAETAFDAGRIVDGFITLGIYDVLEASADFGDGHWDTLSTFEMVLEVIGSGYDYTDLSYAFAPISTLGVANGITLNNSFQLTVTGQDIASGEAFEYFYATSTQAGLPPPDIIVVL